MSRSVIAFVGFLFFAFGGMAIFISTKSTDGRLMGYAVGSGICTFGLLIIYFGIKGKYLGRCPICGSKTITLSGNTEARVVRHRRCKECGAKWIPKVGKISAFGGIIFYGLLIFTFDGKAVAAIFYYLRVLFQNKGQLEILNNPSESTAANAIEE